MLSTVLSNRKRSSQSSVTPRPRRTLQMEPLEDRTLMSASPLGPEFLANLPNAILPGYGGDPPAAVAEDASGNFVVVWASAQNPQSSTYDIFAQRFDPLGNSLGSPFQVNDDTVFGQFDRFPHVDVAMNASGQFVITYDTDNDGNFDILARIYDASGTAQGGPKQIDTEPPTDGGSFNPTGSNSPQVAMNNDGSFAVTFTSFSGGVGSVGTFLQTFDASGKETGTHVSLSDAPLTTSSIATDGNHHYTVTWGEQRLIQGDIPVTIQVVAAQRFLDTTPLDASPITVATPDQLLDAPGVGVSHGDGTIVIAWTQLSVSTQTVMAQRYNADGTPLGSTFQVNTNDVPDTDTLTSPKVIVGNAGDFQIAWVEGQNTQSVQLQQFTAAGVMDGTQATVNTFTSHFQAVDIAGDGAGNFVVAWPGFVAAGEGVTLLAAARIYRIPTIPQQPETPSIPTPLPSGIPDQALAIALARSYGTLGTFTYFPGADILPFVLPQITPPPSNIITPLSAAKNVGGDNSVGEISGRVFDDLNGNGKQDSGEPGIAGVMVFLDLNNNGRHDPGEPMFVTDAEGDYLFPQLPLTSYKVVQDLRVVSEQTFPKRNAPFQVTLTNSVPRATELFFGAKPHSQPTGTPTGGTEMGPPKPTTPGGGTDIKNPGKPTGPGGGTNKTAASSGKPTAPAPSDPPKPE